MRYIITKSIFLISIVSVLLNVASCNSKKNDVIISDVPFVIDKVGVTFACSPPLRRQMNSASIRIEVEGQWEPFPPWKSIRFADGKEVEINVIFTDSGGNTYKSTIIGLAGGMLDVRFEPEIPKDVLLTRIQILSDAEVHCRNIVWHNWNSL